MPFKSEAQKRKFFALRKQGKISQATLDEFLKESKGKKLPKRAKKKKKKKKK